jgi:hypothetical protein
MLENAPITNSIQQIRLIQRIQRIFCGIIEALPRDVPSPIPTTLFE